jgi:uncharacterized protein (DUF885 family)
MNSDFDSKVDEIVNYWWKSNPSAATADGIHEYDDQLERLDRDSRLEVRRKTRSFLRDIVEMEDSGDAYSDDQLLDLKILRAELETQIAMDEEYGRLERDATIYPDLCQYSLYFLLMRGSAPIESKMESALSRLKQVPRLLEEGIENLRRADHVPAAWTRLGIEVSQAGMGFYSAILPIKAMETPSASADINAACEGALASLERYVRILRDEVMPKSDGEYRLGEDLFDYLLKHSHLLPHNCDGLLDIGRTKIDETKRELEDTAREIDPGKSWDDIVDEMKTDTPAAEDLVETYVSETMRARDYLIDKGLLTLPDGEKLEFAETPEFERSRIPYAAYVPPAAFEDSGYGTFWVTPVDLNMPIEQQREQLLGHSRPSIRITSIHEGYPGHHLQLVCSNQVDSLVRKLLHSNVFDEGWALYCEEMMFEEGFYDLRTKLFMLKDQLWRACRVVIDVELHRGNMSFQEAVRMLVDIARLEEVNAISEVKRYTQSPTQPMSYLIGKLEIQKLRDDYRRLVGDRFTLRGFHDKLLSYGTIPVGLVAQRMLNE